ncbi:replication protein [Paenibacillus filicis]|uniref:Replication protein n=1 Tax=Paenibacillus filicis TaxID=669464 RepID=A0ABU9DYS7_9BACL
MNTGVVNPQKERGYVGLANDIWDEIIRRDFTKRQKDILQFIIRLSYGCGRKSAFIAKLKDFSMCGVGKTNISKELIQLEINKVITWDRSGNEFSIIKDYDSWGIRPVREWDNVRFKEMVHENIKLSKKEKVGLSNQEQEVIETITETPDEKFSFQEPSSYQIDNQSSQQEVIETITLSGKELSKQEPEVIETITQTPDLPSNDAASGAPKKGLKKEVIKKELKDTCVFHEKFEMFWSNYPRKIRKKETMTTWNTVIKNGADPDTVVLCCQNYNEQCKLKATEERYILHGSTFLNKERYLDYQEQQSTLGSWMKPQDRAGSFRELADKMDKERGSGYES